MEITKITYRYALNRVLNSGFTKSSTNWDNVCVKRKPEVVEQYYFTVERMESWLLLE